MLRSELIGSVKKISHFLETTNARTVLRLGMESARRPKDSQLSMKNLVSLQIKCIQFATTLSSSDFSVAKNLEIDTLFSGEWWTETLSDMQTESGNGADKLLSASSNVYFSTVYLPRVVSLLSRDESIEPHHVSLTSKNDIITIILPEPDGILSHPDRITLAFQVITNSYSAFAKFRGLSESGLSLNSCDSGSDKIFEFSGISEIIKDIKDFLLSILDLCVFYRERKHQARIELISQSLPILAKLKELESCSAIDAAAAEKIRRELVDSAAGVITSGLHLSEFEGALQFKAIDVLPAKETLLLPRPDDVDADSDLRELPPE